MSNRADVVGEGREVTDSGNGMTAASAEGGVAAAFAAGADSTWIALLRSWMPNSG